MAELGSKFVQGVSKLKLKEVTPYTQQFAKDHLTAGKLNGRFNTWFQGYKEKYIDTGKHIIHEAASLPEHVEQGEGGFLKQAPAGKSMVCLPMRATSS